LSAPDTQAQRTARMQFAVAAVVDKRVVAVAPTVAVVDIAVVPPVAA